jgi:SAM-dependent methyltransferase
MTLYDGLEDVLSDAPGQWCVKRCSEAACGLVWLDPFPLKEDLSQAYGTYYTHVEAAGGGSWANSVRNALYTCYSWGSSVPTKIIGLDRERQELRSMFLMGLPPGQLLDVGCGDGGFLDRMRKRGWAVRGLDFDPKAIESARMKYGLELHQGGIDEAPFPAGSFDAITMNHVIEHLPDPSGALARCLALLKPGGQLVAATPNPGSRGHEEFKNHWRGLEIPRHLHLFPPPALADCARRAGFSVLRAFSTAANADIISGASYSIRGSPNHRLPAHPAPSLPRTLKAMLFQYSEHLLMRSQPSRGEETVLICQKPQA